MFVKHEIKFIALLFCIANSYCTANGQTTSAKSAGPSPGPEFEVASVKPSAPDAPGRGGNFLLPFGNLQPQSGLFSANSSTVGYILFAYDVQDPAQIQSLADHLPQWAMFDRFDIEARADGVPTRDQMRLMMQSLLKHRFKLAVHYETRQGAVNALVLDRPGTLGPKLKVHPGDVACSIRPERPAPAESHLDRPAYCGVDVWNANGKSHFRMTAATMAEAARFLNMMGAFIGDRDMRPIVDNTGLPGKYDVDIEFVPADSSGAAADSEADTGGGPTFIGALKHQLGLKLVKDTGPVETMVIDHIEKPSAD